MAGSTSQRGAQDETSAHELDAPPWRRVDSTLISVARAIRRGYDDVLREIGFSLAEASLLSYVADHGPLTQTHLAGALDSGRANMGLRIDALEKRGLVQRVPDPNDRRVWLVTATPQARASLERIDEIDNAFRNRLRAGISRAERRQLADLLMRIQANLRS